MCLSFTVKISYFKNKFDTEAKFWLQYTIGTDPFTYIDRIVLFHDNLLRIEKMDEIWIETPIKMVKN
jgi:hypothetical protein